MKTKRFLTGALFAGLAFLIGAGCSQDGSMTPMTAPNQAESEASPLGIDRTGLQIDDFTGTKTKDQIVTRVISTEGGMIAVENLSVEFPKGCLSEKTQITLRVRQGEEVLFRVAPVDLKLNCPVNLSFKLRPGDDPKTITFLRYDDALRMLDSRVVGRALVSESDRLGDFLIGPESLDGSKGRAGW
jgi:hypothetical protein